MPDTGGAATPLLLFPIAGIVRKGSGEAQLGVMHPNILSRWREIWIDRLKIVAIA